MRALEPVGANAVRAKSPRATREAEMRTIRHAAMAILLALASTPACADAWPQRTVRVIVPNPPGSAVDLAARLYAERLAILWRQPVFVENRLGADGIIAATAFVNARDDHTLLFSFGGLLTINPLTHEKLPYDPAHDIVPIASAAVNFLAIAATESLKVNSLAEFVTSARSQPGKLNWAATPGLPQYAFAALQKSTGLNLQQVVYRDFAPALQDFAEGRIHALSTSLTLLLPQVQAGKAKMLVVTTRERSPLVPDVPTARETGHPELTFEGVVGFYGWRDISVALKDRIAADVRAVAQDPVVSERLANSGTVVRAGTPAEFAQTLDEQRGHIAAVVRSQPKVQ
jgi:tripartite-type tricarboxylate transporter receptor subunit TctC